MLKDFTKLILTTKAAIDVLKEKLESKAVELALQVKGFAGKTPQNSDTVNEEQKCNLKEKAKEELSELLSEIGHRTQINELQVKGFIKDKLIEITNNALLDSAELNDIRAEIASLRAEVADIKSQIKLTKTV